MAPEPSYMDQIAPYPDPDDPQVAESLARWLTCQVHADNAQVGKHYYPSSPPGDRQAARDFGFLISRVTSNFGVLLLLRTLIDRDPEVANRAAHDLINHWISGETQGELAREWLTAYGIDPARIAAESTPLERLTPPG